MSVSPPSSFDRLIAAASATSRFIRGNSIPDTKAIPYRFISANEVFSALAGEQPSTELDEGT